MSYQNVTGTLSANSHPGSYCGQDAYNDMLIVEDMNEDILGRKSGSRYIDFEKCRGGQRMPDKDNFNCVIEATDTESRPKYIVRRLTPLECERLQGFPDGWTDIGDWADSNGKVHKLSDSHRYKALGNSIALPSWAWVIKRMCAEYERPATMASLFDGIGGFPLIWEQINGKGSCLWASEIEEFPIAVTKERFK